MKHKEFFTCINPMRSVLLLAHFTDEEMNSEMGFGHTLLRGREGWCAGAGS